MKSVVAVMLTITLCVVPAVLAQQEREISVGTGYANSVDADDAVVHLALNDGHHRMHEKRRGDKTPEMKRPAKDQSDKHVDKVRAYEHVTVVSMTPLDVLNTVCSALSICSSVSSLDILSWLPCIGLCASWMRFFCYLCTGVPCLRCLGPQCFSAAC